MSGRHGNKRLEKKLENHVFIHVQEAERRRKQREWGEAVSFQRLST